VLIVVILFQVVRTIPLGFMRWQGLEAVSDFGPFSAESVSEFQIKAMRLTVYFMQSVFHGHSSSF
jgi:hypothetical protein